MDDSEKQLWEAYAASRSTEDRNRLIELHLPVADRIAERMAKRIPVDHDELLSAAYEGLIDAVERFDLSREVKFSTYAEWRVGNHVRDYLRCHDVHTRLHRIREPMVRVWESQLGRNATQDEIYEHFGFRLEKPRNATSLHSEVFGNGQCLLHETIGDRQPNMAIGEASYLLQGLNKRERLAVVLYFVAGYSMRESADAIGVSQSRVSQMMKDLLPRMRANYERAA